MVRSQSCLPTSVIPDNFWEELRSVPNGEVVDLGKPMRRQVIPEGSRSLFYLRILESGQTRLT